MSSPSDPFEEGWPPPDLEEVLSRIDDVEMAQKLRLLAREMHQAKFDLDALLALDDEFEIMQAVGALDDLRARAVLVRLLALIALRRRA
jgi:hypothetical protein